MGSELNDLKYDQRVSSFLNSMPKEKELKLCPVFIGLRKRKLLETQYYRSREGRSEHWWRTLDLVSGSVTGHLL